MVDSYLRRAASSALTAVLAFSRMALVPASFCSIAATRLGREAISSFRRMISRLVYVNSRWFCRSESILDCELTLDFSTWKAVSPPRDAYHRHMCARQGPIGTGEYMSQELLSAMRQSIMDGAPATSAELARQALGDGIMPLEAINSGYVPGMHAVGEQFAKGQMFLPDMLASAEAMRAAMAVLDPELEKLGRERPVAGTVVLGTPQGKIAEIGRSLGGAILSAHGFRVYDLGVDVSGEKFAAKALEFGEIGRASCWDRVCRSW